MTPRRIPKIRALLACCGVALYASMVFPSDSLVLDGNVRVKALDDRRVLVAIDSSTIGAADNRVDHLFLFTASEPIEFSAHEGAGSARVAFRTGLLTLTWEDVAHSFELVIENDHAWPPAPGKTGMKQYRNAIGLSHFEGLGSLSMGDLERIRSADVCEHVDGSCYEADGFPIHFPA